MSSSDSGTLSLLWDRLVDFFAHGLTHASGWQMLVIALVLTHITIASVTI